jgi:hypothetical protein
LTFRARLFQSHKLDIPFGQGLSPRPIVFIPENDSFRSWARGLAPLAGKNRAARPFFFATWETF